MTAEQTTTSPKGPRVKKFQVLFRIWSNGEVFAAIPKFSRDGQIYCRFKNENALLGKHVLMTSKPATPAEAAFLRRKIKHELSLLAEPYKLESLTEWPKSRGDRLGSYPVAA